MRHHWAPLLGAWAVLPDWLALYRGQLEAFMDGRHVPAQAAAEIEARTLEARDLITMTKNAIALIPLHGPMIKRAGFWEMLFGYTGTEMVRSAVQQATADPEIQGIFLHVESPGGHVAGVDALAETVRQAAQVKPVAVHIDDLGASAAYWASAQATRITASPTAEVGSIGTMAVIADMSMMAAQAGIKIHVVSTGPYKGLGVPGTPIDDAQLTEIQRRVDGVNAFFLRAVQRGRALPDAQLSAVADGRVFLAAEAKKLGLIDEVRSTDAALADLGRAIKTGRGQEVRERITQRRAALDELKETAYAISR